MIINEGMGAGAGAGAAASDAATVSSAGGLTRVESVAVDRFMGSLETEAEGERLANLYQILPDNLKIVANERMFEKFQGRPEELESLLSRLGPMPDLRFALEACKRIQEVFRNDLIVADLQGMIAFVQAVLAHEAGKRDAVINQTVFEDIPYMFDAPISEWIKGDDISRAEQIFVQLEIVYSHASRIPELKEQIDRIVSDRFQDLDKVRLVRQQIQRRPQTDTSSGALRFLTRIQIRHILKEYLRDYCYRGRLISSFPIEIQPILGHPEFEAGLLRYFGNIYS